MFVNRLVEQLKMSFGTNIHYVMVGFCDD